MSRRISNPSRLVPNPKTSLHGTWGWWASEGVAQFSLEYGEGRDMLMSPLSQTDDLVNITCGYIVLHQL